MDAHRSVPVFLILLAAVMTCGAAHPTPAVSDVRVVATAPTHLQIDWEGQAEAYRVQYYVYGPRGYGDKSAYSPVVAQGPLTVVNLTPETQYVLRVQALEPEPEEAEEKTFKVLGESKPLAATTEAWEPRQWEDLLLWPSRHMDTFAGGTAHPAVAAYGDKLLVVECYEGAIHVSQVNPETLEVHSTKLIVPARSEGLPVDPNMSRRHIDAVVIQDTLWVSWLSIGMALRSIDLPRVMIASYDLVTQSVTEPVRLHEAWVCRLVSFNGQPCVLWVGRGPRILLGRYDSAVGIHSAVGSREKPIPTDPAAVDLGIEVFVPYFVRVGSPHFDSGHLWAVKFNGQEFYGRRMLRSRGEYSSPTGAGVNNAIVVAYAKAIEEHLSDIDITLTSAEAGEVASTSYIHDGTRNITPDAVTLGDSIYLVYNKWSAGPGSPNAVNYGTFIGKIEPKF